MKPRHLIMAIALAIAAWLAVFGNKPQVAEVVEPIARTPSPTISIAASTATPKATETTAILALLPRENLIGGAPAEAPLEPGLFTSHSWDPPPPPIPLRAKPLPLPPPPPPSAPPLPFTYIGKMESDNTWEVYLARGDKTYIVRDQTVIDNVYRVDTIKPPTLSLTYLPLKQVQTLTIGGTD